MTTEAHRSRPLRFGLTTALPRPAAAARDFARAVEAVGFDVLTFPDHLVPSTAPFTGATGAGVVTDSLHVGTLVLNNDFRHPVETAREAATVATLTGGRFELGIGAGHMKSEYDAAGIPFDGGGQRVSRLEQSARLIRSLLNGEAVDFNSTHYRVHAEAGSLVAPPRERVPILSAATALGYCSWRDTSPTSSVWPASPTTTTPPRCARRTSGPRVSPTGSRSSAMPQVSGSKGSNSMR